jgi:hypothetical protein
VSSWFALRLWLLITFLSQRHNLLPMMPSFCASGPYRNMAIDWVAFPLNDVSCDVSGALLKVI